MGIGVEVENPTQGVLCDCYDGWLGSTPNSELETLHALYT